VVPFRAPFGTAADILKQTADDRDDIFVDYRPQYLELAPSDTTEKYQLSPALRGQNTVTGTRIIDDIHVLDRGSEQVYDRFQVDDLAAPEFIDQLAETDSIDAAVAEDLIEEYGNLRTVSWAATSDVDHLENTWDLDSHELFNDLGNAGTYRTEDSLDAGKLQFPERRADELSEPRQEAMFGEVVAPQDGDREAEDESEQTGLTDF
jgi:hypothetical protein